MRVAVVGCGMSPVGAGLGPEIDGHDLVIRANRAFDVAGKEADWGTRTDILCIGHMDSLRRWIPEPAPFEVIEVEKVWRSYWPHPRKPLAGTFAALHAVRIGASAVTLYGIDLYADTRKEGGRWIAPTVFRRHFPAPPYPEFCMDLDREALETLPCPVTWRFRRS